MTRVWVIGCSGAGKSSLSMEQGRRLQRNVCHLAKLWWLPCWKTDNREKFDAKLDVELKKPTWIIDGDYSRTFPECLKYADTVIFLQYSRWVCLAGVLSRIFRMRWKVRIDMSEGCPERLPLHPIARMTKSNEPWKINSVYSVAWSQGFVEKFSRNQI